MDYYEDVFEQRIKESQYYRSAPRDKESMRIGWRAAVAYMEKENKRQKDQALGMAHEWIRHALDLPEDAPFRFDYYADCILKIKGGHE